MLITNQLNTTILPDISVSKLPNSSSVGKEYWRALAIFCRNPGVILKGIREPANNQDVQLNNRLIVQISIRLTAEKPISEYVYKKGLESTL